MRQALAEPERVAFSAICARDASRRSPRPEGGGTGCGLAAVAAAGGRRAGAACLEAAAARSSYLKTMLTVRGLAPGRSTTVKRALRPLGIPRTALQ